MKRFCYFTDFVNLSPQFSKHFCHFSDLLTLWAAWICNFRICTSVNIFQKLSTSMCVKILLEKIWLSKKKGSLDKLEWSERSKRERGIELIKGMIPYPMNTYLMCVCLYVPKVFMFNGVNMGRKVLRSFSFSFPHSLPTTAIFLKKKNFFHENPWTSRMTTTSTT